MSIATLTIDINARIANIERDLGRAANIAQRNADRMQRAFSGVSMALKTLGVGASIGALSAIVTRTAEAAVEIENLSRVSGAGVEEFQKYAFAASSVGIEQNKLGDIFKDFREKVGEFLQTGGGGMKDFFEQIAPQIGITADAFRDLSGPQAMQLYFDSLEKANLSQEQMSFYLESMASDTTALIPLLRNGGQEFARLGDQAERAGRVMSEEVVAASRQFNNNLRELQASAVGLRNIIAGPLISALADMTTEMLRAAQQGETFLGVLERVLRGGVVGDRAGLVKAAGDIERLSKQYNDFQKQIDSYEATGQSAPDYIVARAGRASAELRLAQENYQKLASDLNKPIQQAPVITAPSSVAAPAMRVPAQRSSAASRVIDEQQQIYEAVQRQIAALEQQAATFGLAERQATLYRLAQEGATDAQKASADVVLREIEILQQRADEQSRINALLEATPTAQLEALRGEMLLLEQAFRSGQISAEQFIEATQTRLGTLGEKAEEAGQKMNAFAEQAARNIQSSFANFLFNPFEDGLSGMLLNFSDTLRRMASELIASKLLNLLGGSLAGAGGPLGAFGTALVGVSGARASGGPVSSGSTYLVGERGPELFVPRQSGSIVPNNKLQSAQPSQNNIRIVNTIDPAFVGDYIASPSGEQVILNVIRRNPGVMRSVVA